MTICNRYDTAPGVEVEYLAGCSQKSNIPSFVLAPEIQTGYPLYAGDDEGWHIIISQEAYNLVKNPTFFNDTNEWTESNSLLLRSNVNSFDMGFSALIRGTGDTITADRRAYIETETEGFAPGQTYVFSMYLWMPELFDSQDPVMGTVSIVDSDGIIDEEVFSGRIESYGKWVRIAVSKTIRTTATSVLLRVNLRSQDQRELPPPYNLTGEFNLEEEYLFADMAQFEQGSTPTTPFHGSSIACTGGECSDCCNDAYKWLSTFHESISYRSTCARDGGVLLSLHDMGFDILEHTGHGAPPVRDIFYDYTNRPGGKYQKTVVDTNVLTLSGYLCDKSLKELECNIFGLQGAIFPDISGCNRQMLLVYGHGSSDCGNIDCDPERYLAYCVSYIGGHEGVRNNLFQQRIALQFRAHDPFPFEWPGQTAHALEFDTIISIGAAVAKIGVNEIRGYPLIEQADYNTLTCAGEQDKFLLGGDFSWGDSMNVLVHDCDEICPQELVGEVNTSTRDSAGNIIFGGAFLSPYSNLAIYYPDIDSWADMGYTGEEVLSVLAPFWAEAVVGAVDGVHIITSTDMTFYPTDGPVNALAMIPSGDLYAFGEFTTIDGVAAVNIAKLEFPECLNIDDAEWKSLGTTLNGAVTTAHSYGDKIYIGGEFTEATPDAIGTCIIINGFKTESKGASQEVRFEDNTPMAGLITLRFIVVNTVAQGFANFCLTGADTERMIRISATSTLGTVYNFIFHEDSVVASDVATINEFNCDVNTTNMAAANATADSTPVGTDTLTFAVAGDATTVATEIAAALIIENQQIANEQAVTLFEIDTDQGLYSFAPSALLSDVAGVLTFDDSLVDTWPFDGAVIVNDISYETLDNCTTIRYVIEITIDKSYTLTSGSCAQDNPALVEDIDDAIRLSAVFAALNYPAGLGIDDTLNNVVIQCVQLDTSYQGDSTGLNYVAVIDGDNIGPVGNGLSSAPNVIFVNPDTGEVLAGTDDGLYIWAGREWNKYPGMFGSACGDQPVIDLDYCNGSLYILYEGSGSSILPGQTNVNYLGGISSYDFELVLHGPGQLHSFTHCKKAMRFCTDLQCGETARFDFNNGSFKSGDRDMGATVLGGSRYDIALATCDNPIKVLITGAEASTRATLLYRRQYAGIEALCCSQAGRAAGAKAVTIALGLDDLDPCCHELFIKARSPSIDDCVSEGYDEGDIWYNAAGDCNSGNSASCPSLFISIDKECCDYEANTLNLIDQDGNVLLDDGNPFCAEEVVP